MKILTHVLIVALALLLASNLIPGIEVIGLYVAIITSVILGLLNLTVRPILFVLTLPITLLTFGLFAFVLNALLVLFAASFIEGFQVTGFIPALLCSLFVSIASTIASKVSDNK